MEIASYPEFSGEPEKSITHNSPPAAGRGEIRAGVRCVPGMLTGIGSLPRFLHDGYFGARGIKTSRGESKRRQLRGKFQFPQFSPALLGQPNSTTERTAHSQSSLPIRKG